MGHGRKHDTLSADAHVSDQNGFAPDRAKVSRRPADFFDLTSGDAASKCCETSVWRQARQMRQEWRRERYSRLKTA